MSKEKSSSELSVWEDLSKKDLSERIIKGEVGASISLISFKISIAILNAAALSG